MPKQQRAIRIEPKGQIAAMQALEAKSDEELEAETSFRSAAQTILGTRAAERYDADKARAHFQKAMVSARSQQERTQIRRVSAASLALAERRAGDLKVAAEKLGVEAPTGRQLFGLRALGLLIPPRSAGLFARIRGIVIILALIIGILALGFGIVELVSLPFGGLSLDLSIFYGVALVFVVLGGLAYWNRRRQKAATAKRDADLAARTGR
jgi:hypothetical protein